MGEEAPVGGEWFLREQEGMEGKGWPEEGRSLLCDGKVWIHFAAGANGSNLHCS